VSRHLPALWFAGLANQLFWWTYAKAWWRSFTSAVCCSKITFKVLLRLPQLFQTQPSILHEPAEQANPVTYPASLPL